MMRAPWRSTFGLAACVSLVFAIITLGIGGVVYEVTHEALEVQLDHRISTETEALLAESGHAGIDRLAAAIRRRDAASSTASLGYILVDRNGRRVAGKLDAAAPKEAGFREFLYHERGTRVAQALTTLLPGGFTLVVAADRAVIDEIDSTILKLFGIALGAMLLLGVGGAWTVGAVTRARLRRIDRTALAIIGGDLTRRMPTDGSGSEFDQVSTTLNRMLDRIAALLENLRQVSSDVAHDLRTPLTRLHNRLDEALTDSDDATRREAIEAAAAESRELLEIFAALLRISEIEAFGVRRAFVTVDMSALVGEMLDTYRPDAETSGHHLRGAIEPGLAAQGDRRLLRQLLANLLDNALRHTPRGIEIGVRLTSAGRTISLSVADNGPGVDPAEAGTLFQRFARSERSRSTPGHGLGLSLVEAVAAAHHGEAALDMTNGFRITVTLPRSG
ncbi:MAG: HAMP domain-containing sensor histidine kinase [Pseudomonadota bacterium]|jgi:signal transduction histidine kinase|uniref:histidine kinase n=1 Tax=hydrothermal vent metagenome TaxID=652676 RepID=A0A160TI09_9ZZZZ